MTRPTSKPTPSQVIEVHVHLPSELASLLMFDGELMCRLANIERGLKALINQGVTMSQALNTLKSEVENNTAVDQSAIQLLHGLAAQIATLKEDPAALQTLADNLRSASAELAAAVAANTPADPNAGGATDGTEGSITDDTGTAGV